MDTDQIKQAQEAWKERAENSKLPADYSRSYLQGISDLKASLEKTFSDHLKDVRKEFDALTGEEETALEEEIELSARIDTLKWVLELLNTCKPTN